MPQQHCPDRWRSPEATEDSGARVVRLRIPPLKPICARNRLGRRATVLVTIPMRLFSLLSHPFDPSPHISTFYLSFPKGHLLPSQSPSSAVSLFNGGSFRTPISPTAQHLLPGRGRRKFFPCSNPKPLTERQKGEPEQILAHHFWVTIKKDHVKGGQINI